MPQPLPINRYIVFILIVVAGAAADLVSKDWIFAKLWGDRGPDGRKIWIWPDYVAWELGLNEGALFGIGQGLVWLFAVLSFLAAAGILVWLFWIGAARHWWLTIALAMVFAGILGNLYDRLGMHQLTWPEELALRIGREPGGRIYAVRDWILLTYRGHKWPNFNIADSLLVCGAAMLFVHSLFGYPHSDASSTSEGSSSEQDSPS